MLVLTRGALAALVALLAEAAAQLPALAAPEVVGGREQVMYDADGFVIGTSRWGGGGRAGRPAGWLAGWRCQGSCVAAARLQRLPCRPLRLSQQRAGAGGVAASQRRRRRPGA
jgi:hypothetical protein